MTVIDPYGDCKDITKKVKEELNYKNITFFWLDSPHEHVPNNYSMEEKTVATKEFFVDGDIESLIEQFKRMFEDCHAIFPYKIWETKPMKTCTDEEMKPRWILEAGVLFKC